MFVVRLFFLFLFIVGIGLLIHDHPVVLGRGTLIGSDGRPHPIPYRGKNRLGNTRSPYLRSAASQPVWWFEWGADAFQMAKVLRRPILLDIGADWCHWCHVMDHDTYMSAEVAALINAHFIPIKVDRDERPDLDHRYQIAVRAIANTNGWPLTAFLTPDGDVYYGGTTFFAQARDERPGFLDLLPRLAAAYEREGASIQQAALFLREQLGRFLMIDTPSGRLNDRHLVNVAEAIARDFDQEQGGTNPGGPKFPEPQVWRYLLEWQFYDRAPRWRAMAELTLQRMAAGGIHDQLGGGFHRYAVDGRWRAPHFEKMLAGNAAIGELYLTAYRVTKQAAYLDVAREIIHYLLQILRDPDTGWFAEAQDADSPTGAEGDYYTWRKEEIAEVLSGEDRQVAMLAFGVEEIPREIAQQPGRNVLVRAATTAEIAARLGWSAGRVTEVYNAARAKLLIRRAGRSAPPVRRSIYVGTNGMAIHLLFRGALIAGEATWHSAALAALDRLMTEAWDPTTGMARGFVGGVWDRHGLLIDQAWTLTALLDAYEATGEAKYLAWAEALAGVIERRFGDPAGGGFFDRPMEREASTDDWGLAREPSKPFFDEADAAANPIVAMAYDRLAYLTDNLEWRTTVDGILLSLAGMHVDSVGRSLASYVSAVLYHLRPPAHVVVVGNAGDRVAEALIRMAAQHERPHVILQHLPMDVEPADTFPAALRTQIAAARAQGRALAFCCVGTTCAAPTADPTELNRQLATIGRAR